MNKLFFLVIFSFFFMKAVDQKLNEKKENAIYAFYKKTTNKAVN